MKVLWAITRGARIALLTGLSSGLLAPNALAQRDETMSELPDDFGGFVGVDGQKLTLNGGDFYFSGANSYAMLYSPEQAEEQMRIARSMGINAIRMWGFWDGEEPTVDENGEVIPDAPSGTDRWGRAVLQSRPREYSELGFRKFDRAIYLAHVYGMKLIIPLLNEWDEFGGLKQYLKWADLYVPEDVEGFYANENNIKAERYQFFESQVAQDIYFDYVSQVLNRTNTITGVKYKDDPAIMIWEVMNEPRFGPWEADPSGEKVAGFLEKSAKFIKSIDSKHLVGTGEEGFLSPEDTEGSGLQGYAWSAAAGEGSSFRLNSEIEEIDVLTFHGWPFNWAMASEFYQDNINEFMPEWIEEHARIAREIGKPLYLGEFGWQILRREGSDLEERDALIEPAYQAVLDNDLAGVAYWHITESHNPEEARYTGEIERSTLDSAIYTDTVVPHDQEFRFDIYCPEDVSTCALIEKYTEAMVSQVENPDPPFLSSCFSPRTVCGEMCVLLDSHPDHCGSCGNSCAAGQVCTEGACTDRQAAPPWHDGSSPYDTSASCQLSSPATPLPARTLALCALISGTLLFRRRSRL